MINICIWYLGKVTYINKKVREFREHPKWATLSQASFRGRCNDYLEREYIQVNGKGKYSEMNKDIV